MMKLPIVLTPDGLAQIQTPPDYVRLSVLNIGPATLHIVISEAITVTTSNLVLASPNATVVNLDNINGGEDGMVLIARGDNVRLRSNGNLRLKSNFQLNPNDTIVLFKTVNFWVELSRSDNNGSAFP